jgi:hypothetical protein
MGPVLVYPQFIGRLGNNLFQIAATIGYSKKYNVGWGIQKGYIEPGFQVYQVDQFLPWLPSNQGYHFRRYEEPSYNFREIPFNPQGVRLVGFFQSSKYFEHCHDEVKKWIKIPFVEGWSDHCAIHARRGDYVDLDTNFPPVTIEYFQQAIPIMQSKGYSKFFVCSDGIEWCEDVLPKSFPNVHFEFSKGRNEWQDMSVMASCGSNIIANSSFSWWAAYLNPSKNKTVISPDNTSWYGPDNGVVREAKAKGYDPCIDLVPSDWIKIKFR